ncbi:hypothetical protein CRM22_004057 [Opisthorchis felineus]|uniref:Btz domain-containing protein n=1 Tax=Opisthorchis felineus TaxID=147828 RepID=A0A4S2LY90_OPIFE|nr:hypothetical protein CRM22_004057 [Opisthorchis felineus]
MEVARSRRRKDGKRHRSPNSSESRSRSRSPISRRMHRRRSSSRERLRSSDSYTRDRAAGLSKPTKDLTTQYGSTARDRSLSPVRGTSPFPSAAHMDSMTRLRQPEIQSSVYYVPDFQNESGRFSSSHVNPPPITLTERFARLTASGTTVYNKRYPGKLLDTRRIPHLIITNNSQLPPATLLRQAKAISIVIERKIPPGRKRTADVDTSLDTLFIPRRSTEGQKPVFDRPEIRFYRVSSDESLISERLLDCINSSSSKHDSKRHPTSSQYHDVVVIGAGRFYGSRVEQSGAGPRNVHPLDPLDTPRNSSYFLHDVRGELDLTSRRSWRTQFASQAAALEKLASGYRREYRDRRSPGSPERPNSPRGFSPRRNYRGMDSGRWQHDKFEELERQEAPSQSKEPSKAVPKPVPAPKPILWSTIGKEINTVTRNNSNEEVHFSNSFEDGSPRSVRSSQSSKTAGVNRRSETEKGFVRNDDSEDVRIDMEPVLDETIDDS